MLGHPNKQRLLLYYTLTGVLVQVYIINHAQTYSNHLFSLYHPQGTLGLSQKNSHKNFLSFLELGAVKDFKKAERYMASSKKTLLSAIKTVNEQLNGKQAWSRKRKYIHRVNVDQVYSLDF